jgi:hypothetical protein
MVGAPSDPGWSSFLVGVRVRPPDRVTRHYHGQAKVRTAGPSANQAAARHRYRDPSGYSSAAGLDGTPYESVVQLGQDPATKKPTLTVTHFVKSATTQSAARAPSPQGNVAVRSGSSDFRREDSRNSRPDTPPVSARANGTRAERSAAGLRRTQTSFGFDVCFVPQMSREEASALAAHGLEIPKHTDASQAAIHAAVGVPTVDHLLKGYNTCLMAYGQTGSGKTYTMLGPSIEGRKDALISSIANSEERGLMLRTTEYLFQRLYTQRYDTQQRNDMLSAVWGDILRSSDLATEASSSAAASPRFPSITPTIGSRHSTPVASAATTPRFHVKSRVTGGQAHAALDTASNHSSSRLRSSTTSAATHSRSIGPDLPSARTASPNGGAAAAPSSHPTSAARARSGTASRGGRDRFDDIFGVAIQRSLSADNQPHASEFEPTRRSNTRSPDTPDASLHLGDAASDPRAPTAVSSPLVPVDVGPGEVEREFRRRRAEQQQQQHQQGATRAASSRQQAQASAKKQTGHVNPSRRGVHPPHGGASGGRRDSLADTPGKSSVASGLVVSDDSDTGHYNGRRSTSRRAQSRHTVAGASPAGAPPESVNLSNMTDPLTSDTDEGEGGDSAPGAPMPAAAPRPLPGVPQHQQHHAAANPLTPDAAMGNGSFDPSMYEETTHVSVSYYQIYNEKVWCLLHPTDVPLRVREHAAVGVYVPDLASLRVADYHSLVELLEHGNRNRYTAATVHNRNSSRSHAIFSIKVERLLRFRAATDPHDAATASTGADPDQRPWMHSLSASLNLVDLAGSERVGGVSDAVSSRRVKEANDINSSLTTLAKVIHALTEKQRVTPAPGTPVSATPRGTGMSFIPYRESALTWLLRDCLGGNARTVMLATVSPELKDVEETLNTLRYSSRARSIENRPVVNAKTAKNQAAIIASMHRELVELRARLAERDAAVEPSRGIPREPTTMGTSHLHHGGNGGSPDRLSPRRASTSADATAEDAARERSRLAAQLAEREALMQQISTPPPARAAPSARGSFRQGSSLTRSPGKGSGGTGAAAAPQSPTRATAGREPQRQVALGAAGSDALAQENERLRSVVENLTRLNAQLTQQWTLRRDGSGRIEMPGGENTFAAQPAGQERRVTSSPTRGGSTHHARPAAAVPTSALDVSTLSAAREPSLLRGPIATPFVPGGDARRDRFSSSPPQRPATTRQQHQQHPQQPAQAPYRREPSAGLGRGPGGVHGPGGPSAGGGGGNTSVRRSLSLLYTDSSDDEVTQSQRRRDAASAGINNGRSPRQPSPSGRGSNATTPQRRVVSDTSMGFISKVQSPLGDAAPAGRSPLTTSGSTAAHRQAPPPSSMPVLSSPQVPLTGPAASSAPPRAFHLNLPPRETVFHTTTEESSAAESDEDSLDLIQIPPMRRPMEALDPAAAPPTARSVPPSGPDHARFAEAQRRAAGRLTPREPNAPAPPPLGPLHLSHQHHHHRHSHRTAHGAAVPPLGLDPQQLRAHAAQADHQTLERSDSNAKRIATPRSVAFSDDIHTTTYRPTQSAASFKSASAGSPHAMSATLDPNSEEAMALLPAHQQGFSEEARRRLLEIRQRREELEARRRMLDEHDSHEALLRSIAARQHQQPPPHHGSATAAASRPVLNAAAPTRSGALAETAAASHHRLREPSSVATFRPDPPSMHSTPDRSGSVPDRTLLAAPSAGGTGALSPMGVPLRSPERRTGGNRSPSHKASAPLSVATMEPLALPDYAASHGGARRAAEAAAGQVMKTPPASRRVGGGGSVPTTPESQQAVDSVQRSFHEAMREMNSWRSTPGSAVQDRR